RGGSEGEPELLAEAYKNSLRLAVEKGLKTIAFPSISTGAYGYPIEKASRIALKTIKEFLEGGEASLNEVRIVLFRENDLKIYEEAVKEVF
ncbi:MAG: macro domain-containing protein, partial [Candidatus Bathyarchaeia archaeon]